MEQANNILIPLAANSPQGAWADDRDGERIAIRHYQWAPGSYCPLVNVTLSYTAEELQISFRVYEANPLIRFTGHNDPVYKDSCVEFFVQPTPETDARYLNLELNAGGALLVGLGTDRHDRLYLVEQEVPPLYLETEVDQLDEITGESYWTARLRIPMEWLTKVFPDFVPRSGATLRGNFYKCGDETAVPHYGSWSKMTSSIPDYHRSEDFGSLTLA